jgi:hypothetical protein
MSNPTARRSKYDLGRAWNYMRLACQSMSRDQDEARAAVESCAQLPVFEQRLLALSGYLALCIGKLIEEKDKVQ